MRTKFFIIGLTGPIGSGCSITADFLSTGLQSFSQDVTESLSEIKTLIGKYYRYLKKMQFDKEAVLEVLDKKISSMLIEPEELYNAQMHFYKDTQYNSEIEQKIINRRLRGLIIKRDIYKAFIGNNWPSITVISMSDLILKLAVQEALDKDLKTPSHFLLEHKLQQSIKDRIHELARKHKTTLDQFDDTINNKRYDDLDYNTCKSIDQAFEAIHELKRYVYGLEKKDEEWLQNLGDNLRATGNPYRAYSGEKFKNLDIIAYNANNYIKYMWRRHDGKSNNYFVIDSFRNPEEVNFFRKRYGTFFLCSLYAEKSIRKKRLQENGKVFSEMREKRDQGIGKSSRDLHKQNVPGCVLIADYSINNEQSLEDLKYKIIRLLILIERPGWITPTTEEVFMQMAYSLSLRSRCVSRQVGAVITNSDGFVIGAGWNDVGSGQLGCSGRCVDDYYRYIGTDSILSVWEKPIKEFEDAGILADYDKEDYFCFKDLQSELLISNKLNTLLNEYIESNGIDETEKRKYLSFVNVIKKKLGVKRLEFARALHAEENAILQVATYGGMGIQGGTIYTTTFPCELCAKKIYQSGINRVVFTEPYPDSISQNVFLKDGVRRVSIEQFEGVKSNSYYKLFKSPLDRKDMQKINDVYYGD